VRESAPAGYAPPMELEIEPEPTTAERAAIEAVLEQQSANGAQPFAYRSAWRSDGIRENALDPSPAEPADQQL
jgi:hypothetical protein